MVFCFWIALSLSSLVSFCTSKSKDIFAVGPSRCRSSSASAAVALLFILLPPWSSCRNQLKKLNNSFLVNAAILSIPPKKDFSNYFKITIRSNLVSSAASRFRIPRIRQARSGSAARSTSAPPLAHGRRSNYILQVRFFLSRVNSSQKEGNPKDNNKRWAEA